MLIASLELKTGRIPRIKVKSSSSFDNYGLLISQLLADEFNNAQLWKNREENLFLGTSVCQKSTSNCFICKIDNCPLTIPSLNFIALDIGIKQSFISIFSQILIVIASNSLKYNFLFIN